MFPVSLVGLLLELGGAVRESNIEFFSSLDDGLSKWGTGEYTNSEGRQDTNAAKRKLTWS